MPFSFVNEEDASRKRLAYVNDAGNAIMRVDNTTELKFGDNRDTVNIRTKDRFTVGSVWIVDMLHVPYGVCQHGLFLCISLIVVFPVFNVARFLVCRAELAHWWRD